MWKWCINNDFTWNRLPKYYSCLVSVQYKHVARILGLIWLSQTQCISIWTCLFWTEACLHGKNIQVSWQSTVKIFYCFQQPSLTWFCILPVSQLRRLSICHTLWNEPITYLIFTLFVGASMIMTLENSPLHNLQSKYTYSELFSDKSHYTGIQMQLTCPVSVLQQLCSRLIQSLHSFMVSI